MKVIINKKKTKLVEALAEELLKLYGGDEAEREACRAATKVHRTRVAVKVIEFLNTQKELKEDLDQFNNIS